MLKGKSVVHLYPPVNIVHPVVWVSVADEVVVVVAVVGVNVGFTFVVPTVADERLLAILMLCFLPSIELLSHRPPKNKAK